MNRSVVARRPSPTVRAAAPPLGRRLGRAALYLALAAGAVIFAFPLVWLVSTSLKPEPEVFLYPPTLLGSRLAWENYPQALERFPFVAGLTATLLITVSVEVGRLLTAPLVAYAFARLDFPGRGPLFILVLSTMLLPYHVTLIPQYLLFRSFGWLDSYLPLIVPAFFGGGAFYIFLMRQFFLTIPREYDDAAEIDGCGPLGIYWRILLPLAKPALGAVAIFTFMAEWNDFFAPLIYLNSQEKYTLALHFKTWETLSQSVQAAGYQTQPYNRILALATLVTLIPLAVFFLTQRLFIQGVVVSGVKG